MPDDEQHTTEASGDTPPIVVVAVDEPVPRETSHDERFNQLQWQIEDLRVQISELYAQLVQEEENEDQNDSGLGDDDSGIERPGDENPGSGSGGTDEKASDTAPEITHWLFRRRGGRRG